MAEAESHLQHALRVLGMVIVLNLNGRNFYDTKGVFDRHNFARDVRRNVDEGDWIFKKPHYLLSERGIAQFAFRKQVDVVLSKIMGIFDGPADELNESPSMVLAPLPREEEESPVESRPAFSPFLELQ